MEDTENTEHDLSAVASSLEGNPMASGITDDNVLEEIMERLLEREPNGGNATMEIDDDPNLGYDHERDATVCLFVFISRVYKHRSTLLYRRNL